MAACITDLLDEHRTPRRADHQLAVVALSRVKRLDSLLVAQPFAPALFRLGEVPGPTLNLLYHLNELSENQLKDRWEETARKQNTQKKQLRFFQMSCASCLTFVPLQDFAPPQEIPPRSPRELLHMGSWLRCRPCTYRATRGSTAPTLQATAMPPPPKRAPEFVLPQSLVCALCKVNKKLAFISEVRQSYAD